MNDVTTNASTATAEKAAESDSMMMSLRGISKSYATPRGRLSILDDLNLDVYESEFLLIEGPSGVGKSTLLHLMGLLDRPDSGEVIVDGVDLARASRRRRAAMRARRVAFVFQFFHLLPELTAQDNVMLPGMITNSVLSWFGARRGARERAEELLEEVGLKERMKHRPHQLSGGERQRVALARALFSRPALVLCDEPTGNLDVGTSEEMHALLARLNDETGQTMVVVTHDLGLSRYAQRTVRLEDRRIVEPSTRGEAGGESEMESVASSPTSAVPDGVDGEDRPEPEA